MSEDMVTINVNGANFTVSSDVSLLWALRDECGLLSAKPGCGEGFCGACTVLVDGSAVRACKIPVSDVALKTVTTAEGLAVGRDPHPVVQAYVQTGAVQCGYCTPAMVLATAALLATNPHPNDDEIAAALSANVCRCGAYPRIRQAVHLASELAAQASPEAGHSLLAAGAVELVDPGPHTEFARPARPWDLTEPLDRDWFQLLGDGLIVVSPPPPREHWSTAGGAWLHVGVEGAVTAFTGKVDMGQDNVTGLRLLVAEELGVPLARVRLVMGDTDLCPYDRGTFGSRSMPDAGQALQAVAARARRLLGETTPTGRHVEVITAMPPLRQKAVWKIAGSPHIPEGIVDAVTGRRVFVSDLALPGMLSGAVLHPPVPGARLRSLAADALASRPDVTLVNEPPLVGVVAPSIRAARSAVALLNAEWELPALPDEAGLETFLRRHPDVGATGWGGSYRTEQGAPDAALADAPIVCRATYSTAFLAHVPLETRAALAVWDGPRVTVWTGTQTPFPVRAQVATLLETDEEQVRVIVAPTGGAFGGKHAADVAGEAAVLARAVHAPVKVMWTRHEEFVTGTLRPAAVIDIAAGASPDGEMTAWIFKDINAGAAGIGLPYLVADQRIEFQPALSPLRQGSYRALAATANNFARESFIDELAHQCGMDPLEFRLRNLDDERLVEVLRTAAREMGWHQRSRPSDGCVGHGIACGLEKDGRVATAVRVVVDGRSRLRVTRLVTAYDCGSLVNPDTVRNQVEGATVMALGGAIFEAIHFTGHGITNAALSDYPVPRMKDVPPIDVVLIDRPDTPPAGAGETPMIAVAPAIANAVFDATGRRVRQLPLTVGGALRSS